jgi:TRAP-type uncharacterized transport system substrate-binding protein
MRRLRPLIALLLLLPVAGFLAWYLRLPAPVIFISSGEPGGTYYEVGVTLDAVLEEAFPGFPQDRDVDFVNLPSHGAVENVMRVATGAAQLGLAEEGIELETLPAHARGPDRSAGTVAQHQIRTLLQLFNSPLKIIARREIGPQNGHGSRLTGLGDLRPLVDQRHQLGLAPLKAYIGAEGSGTRQISRLVLEHYAYSARRHPDDSGPADLLIVGHDWTFEQAREALEDRRIDLGFFLTAFGSPAVRDLAGKGQFVLLEIDRAEGIHRSHPYLDLVEVPAASYPASAKFPESVIRTLAAGEVLIGSSSLTDQQAYRIVETMFNHSHELGSAFPFMVPFSKSDQLGQRFYYPPHPGATAFFQGRPEPQGLIDFFQRYRDVMVGIFSLGGTAWAIFHFWAGRWRTRPLVRRLGETLKPIDIYEVEFAASHLYATGKINKETYESVKEFVRVRLNEVTRDQ